MHLSNAVLPLLYIFLSLKNTFLSITRYVSRIRESTNSPEPFCNIPQIPAPSRGVELSGISFFPRRLRDNNFAGNLAIPRSIEIIQLPAMLFLPVSPRRGTIIRINFIVIPHFETLSNFFHLRSSTPSRLSFAEASITGRELDFLGTIIPNPTPNGYGSTISIESKQAWFRGGRAFTRFKPLNPAGLFPPPPPPRWDTRVRDPCRCTTCTLDLGYSVSRTRISQGAYDVTYSSFSIFFSRTLYVRISAWNGTSPQFLLLFSILWISSSSWKQLRGNGGREIWRGIHIGILTVFLVHLLLRWSGISRNNFLCMYEILLNRNWRKIWGFKVM